MVKKYLCIAFFVATASVAALPPPVPSAGVVEREIEKEYEGEPLEKAREVPAVQIDIPRERLELPWGRKVQVDDVKIVGNHSISTKELKRCIRKHLGQKLALQEIYDVCEIIDRCYAEKGYFLARAYPPPQTIEDGVLTIEVIEGRLGTIEVVGNKHYSESFIKSYFSGLKGKALCYDDFIRALMLLNDNSDLVAGAVFEKGKEFGTADVILQVKDKRPIHLYLNGNNYGRNLTTNVRAGGRLDWGNLITQGDKFSVAPVVGFPVNALYFADASYTVPVNRQGTSLEVAYLFSKFKIEELTRLHLRGSSNIATLKVNQAVLRRRTLSLDFFSYFDYKQIENFVLSHRTSYDKLRVITAGFLLDHFDPSRGRDYLNFRFAAGIPDFLGGLKAVDSQSSRRGGGGRFYIFNADYDRIQQLPLDCYLYLHGSGQLSPSKLTLPEQIYIGGVDTVRGFPLAEALGDSGYYVNCEFRFPIPFLANKKFFNVNKKWKEIIQFDAFVDNGGVFLQSERNTILWGSGVGVRVNGPWTLALSIDVGFPLNHRDHNRDAFIYIKLTCQPF